MPRSRPTPSRPAIRSRWRRPPPAATDAPYQWVLRRMFLGRFLDSDKVYFPENGGFKLVELAPNVQHVQGGAANNLIVAMKDGLVIFDAPVDEGQSRWVIDAAKAKYPGKPVKQLVMTHHHMDHSGGTRTFAAEGAEIVVPGQARAVLREDAPDTAYAEARRAGEAAEAGEDRGREGHDDAQGRHHRGQAAQHPEPACRRHDHRAMWSVRTSSMSPT